MQKSRAAERRQYIRLDSVFPVEIYIKKSRSEEPRLVQGFTCDVSLGGLCLSVNDPDDLFLSMVASGGFLFDVLIDIPITRKPIEASVKAAWHELNEKSRPRRLVVGVAYERIDPSDRKRIISVARKMKWLPKIAMGLILVLVSLLGASIYRQQELVNKNKELIARFYQVQETSDVYKRSVNKIDEKVTSTKSELALKEKAINDLNDRLTMIATQQTENLEALKADKAELEKKLTIALKERAALSNQLKGITANRAKAEKLYREVGETRKELQEATTSNMYEWLRTHQNKFSGLVMSFEGDPSTSEVAFTYDQALAAQAFVLASDYDRAAKILYFYRNKAERSDGGFFNAYNSTSGAPSESVVHVGPNVWIAIAAIHYYDKTNSREYLQFAEDVARWVMMQKDSEGGLKGGPGLPWYSTEHNLDAYALFNMLYTITRKDVYKRQGETTLNWIREYTYSQSDGGMRRGKGDSTIATDTLAWAIAAVGPATLLKEKMDPDGIINFAEEHCRVSTTFARPDGDIINVKGFDFAKLKNVARSGIISTEWTAQMVISFAIMADFYFEMNQTDKAEAYKARADMYLNELDKMVISSPSPSGQGAGCLPYASQPNADTGHGWRTPQGGQTGSVSGTTYTIFARKDYNPLSLEWKVD
jgi:hypothetical protein